MSLDFILANLINAILSGGVLLFVNRSLKARDDHDQSVTKALQQVSRDLQDINTLLAGDYMKRAEIEAHLQALRLDLKEEGNARRDYDTRMSEKIQTIQLDLARGRRALDVEA